MWDDWNQLAQKPQKMHILVKGKVAKGAREVLKKRGPRRHGKNAIGHLSRFESTMYLQMLWNFRAQSSVSDNPNPN